MKTVKKKYNAHSTDDVEDLIYVIQVPLSGCVYQEAGAIALKDKRDGKQDLILGFIDSNWAEHFGNGQTILKVDMKITYIIPGKGLFNLKCTYYSPKKAALYPFEYGQEHGLRALIADDIFIGFTNYEKAKALFKAVDDKSIRSYEIELTINSIDKN